MADPANMSTDRESIMAPLQGFAAVTPHDTNELANHSRAVYVGVSGDVKLTSTGGSTVTLVGLAAGIWHPIRAKIIFSTDTTATSIVVGY